MAITELTTTHDVAALERSDRAHIIHPYLPGSVTERVIMTGGHGCSLTDAEGREYLDATGQRDRRDSKPVRNRRECVPAWKQGQLDVAELQRDLQVDVQAHR